jgi:hypothetical protein
MGGIFSWCFRRIPLDSGRDEGALSSDNRVQVDWSCDHVKEAAR